MEGDDQGDVAFDTFITQHQVEDGARTACVYSGAIKLKADGVQPQGEAATQTAVLEVPESCIPSGADEFKVLANVYNGEASSLPQSNREVLFNALSMHLCTVVLSLRPLNSFRCNITCSSTAAR